MTKNILIILFMIFIVVKPMYSQTTTDGGVDPMMKMLEEAMNRNQALMHEMLKNKKGFMEDMDDKMEQMLRHLDENGGLGGVDPFFGNSNFGSEVKKEWSDVGKDRVLTVTVPGKSDKSLDIKVNDQMITLSGRFEEKKEDKNVHGSSFSMSIRSVSESIPIPEDLDARKVKIEKGKTANEIIFRFPYKKITTDPNRNNNNSLTPEAAPDDGISI